MSKYPWFGRALGAACAALILCGCNGVGQSSAEAGASSQAQLDRIARQLQVRYQLIANRGEGFCVLPGVSGDSGEGNCFEVDLALTAPEAIAADSFARGWAIYFSQTDPLLKFAKGEFEIEHINGDLHKITPSEDFRGFAAGETKHIHFIVKGLNLTEAKIMPNYYIAADNLGLGARTIESTRLQVDAETGLEVRPYAADIPADQFKAGSNDDTPLATSSYIYKRNQRFASDPIDSAELAATRIIPAPAQMTLSGGQLDLATGVAVTLRGFSESELSAAFTRLEKLGVKRSDRGVPLNIRQLQTLKAEPAGSYRLEIDASGIEIQAADSSGAFYALQSIAALLMPNSTAVAQLAISDSPRYSYRGMHVDVGRNFHSKQLLLDLLDQMAAYKLNKLHLHLGEDEGWRLEIPGLPELTDIGSRRCHDPSEDSCLLMQLGSGPTGETELDGYYSRADYIELVKAAEARHIQLIPSFDMPGHSRAVIKSMEARYRKYMAQGDREKAEQYLLSDLNDKTEYQSIQYYSDNTINACMESPYAFLGKVIDEVKKMHVEAGQPLAVYHIGADETAGAWADSPICQAFFADNDYGVKSAKELGPYFIQRVAALLEEKGIKTAGWSDGLSHTDPAKMPKVVQSNIWDVLPWSGVAEANKQANRGWDVVLSTPDALYFDFPYQPEPKEGGYYWATRHTDTNKVFNFMPGNLPAMAEVYRDPAEHGFAIDDDKPLNKGASWKGIQGQIWSETIRSDEAVEYMVFPRLLALAERAWHKPAWALAYDYAGAKYSADSGKFNRDLQRLRDTDWHSFANALGHKEFAKLDAAGIAYRVPTPGAVIEDGKLKANLAYPGLVIEYRESGGVWQRYLEPVAVKGDVQVRAVAADGTRRGRTVRVM